MTNMWTLCNTHRKHRKDSKGEAVIEVNWHPWATNPLDFVVGHGKGDCELVTYNGEPVTISRTGGDFVVTIGGHREITGSNINTCYYLNVKEVRIA